MSVEGSYTKRDNMDAKDPADAAETKEAVAKLSFENEKEDIQPAPAPRDAGGGSESPDSLTSQGFVNPAFDGTNQDEQDSERNQEIIESQGANGVSNGNLTNGNTERPSFLHEDSTYDLENDGKRILKKVDDNNSQSPDEEEEISLIFAKHEKIPMKNFAVETRGAIDVENFLQSAKLLLDMHGSNVETIIKTILTNLFEGEDQTLIDDAMKTIFTHDGVHHIARTIQSSCSTLQGYGGMDFEQSWLCVLSSLPNVSKRHVAIARLRHPVNMGRTCQEVQFIILIVAPMKEKGTKTAMETGRSFATIFADVEMRHQLLDAQNAEQFTEILRQHTQELADRHSPSANSKTQSLIEEAKKEQELCWFARGIRLDFKRRIKHYLSDYKDGFVGKRTIAKTISTTAFLYFACLLPCIALGSLNSTNTNGAIDVRKVIISQTIGGLFFALFGGQPMVILLTTAPLALYTKVIYTICEDLDLDFAAMYAMTGIWNAVFLVIYSLLNASNMMKWSTRSTEEIFALFISIAFTVDCFKDVAKDFNKNYYNEKCYDQPEMNVSEVLTSTPSLATTAASMINSTGGSDGYLPEYYGECLRENSLLFLLLVLGTAWVGLYLFNFTKTPFLNAHKREMLADYALPVAVLFMAFIGSYVFRDIKLVPFSYKDGNVFQLAPFHKLGVVEILGALGLGFSLSLLFFMDQNISAAMVMSPEHRLKKGSAYHWDLTVVAILNCFLTIFGMPMMHGALPHSPLHVRAMADVEERVDQGHVHQQFTYVRETRITGIFAHILIGVSILLLPTPLQYIPVPVLDGLFLYLAITALGNIQMFERIMLLVTEQAAYPPNHYVRSVPQRKMHLFTTLQLVQLGVMCAFGFSPIAYMKMVFPVLIMLLLPIRHKLIPKVIEKKFLKAIDGH